MAKVRVYELAKELGVESKVVLAKLQDMGEFVRSASSTVEPPVVRKLKEVFPPAAPAPEKKATAKKAAAKTAAAAESSVAPPAVEVSLVVEQPAPIAAAPTAPPVAPEVEPAAAVAPRPAGPRPGNNPFTSREAAPPRPAGPRPGNNPFTSKDPGIPRPVARAGGPHPAGGGPGRASAHLRG